MKKTMLILPPVTTTISDYTIPLPPLGLAYMAAVLEQNGYDVCIMDAFAEGIQNKKKNKGQIRIGLSEKQIQKKLKEYKPDIIGINCSHSSNHENSLKMAKIARKTLPKTKIIMGGSHASTEYEKLLKKNPIDIIVLGEGEQTLLEIVQDKKLEKIKGIAYKKNKKIIRNPDRQRIKNLDNLPFPARHLLPMHVYLSKENTDVYLMRSPATSILTSRGCTKKCVFCTIHCVWGQEWIGRSPENIVEEMKQLIQEYGIREFVIVDDNFTLNRERIIQLCNLIIKEGLDVRMRAPSGLAMWTLDEEVLDKLKQAGFYCLDLSIESSSEKILKYLGKPNSTRMAKQIIDYANSIGLWTKSYFIIGFPEETIESINKTIKYASELGIDYARFQIATPYPGTRLYEECVQKKLIKPGQEMFHSLVTSEYNTKHLTSKELNKAITRAYSEFFKKRITNYMRPDLFMKQLWPKIKKPENLEYFIRTGTNMIRARIKMMRTGSIQTTGRI